MAKIYALEAKEIFDSRGIPTIELLLWLDNGFSTITTVPTPTSDNNKFDASYLKDDDERFLGFGVQKAVNHINQIIAPQILEKEITSQGELDKILLELDGTPNKSRLGANAILAVSQAVLKAGAISVGLPLYEYIQKKYNLIKEFNLPNCIVTAFDGGEHGGKNLDFQEFSLIPASHLDLDKSLEMLAVIKQKLEILLVSKGAIHATGLTGGFTPNLYRNLDAFELLVEAIRTTSYNFAQDVFFGLQASAYRLFEAGKYRIRDANQGFTEEEMLEFYEQIREKYKIIYLEDPLIDSDKKSWQALNRDLGDTTTIAACRHVAAKVTEIDKIKNDNMANAIVLKPKQIGTISELMESIKTVKDHQLNLIISHSTGETLETLIVDLAVGVGANFVKFGPLNRGERIAKYNRLLDIGRELKSK
jgi:enolase